MDRGNRDDEDRPGLSVSPHHHGHRFAHQHQTPYSDAQPGLFFSPSLVDPLPVQGASPYGVVNAHALAANAAVTADVFAGSQPDDFYRNFRGDSPVAAPGNDLLASALPLNRQMPSSRSGGTASTTKHPPLSAAGRIGLRPSSRSASNPVDDRLGGGAARSGPSMSSGYSGVAQTSVKDLKKRFDHSTSQQPAQRTVLSRVPSREVSASSSGARISVNGVGQPSHSSVRAGASREPTADSKHRTKFAEDDFSNNPDSFASRVNKPRSSISSSEQASKSTPHLPPQASTRPHPSSPPAAQPNGLLFGEILPEQTDSTTAGYGIDGVRPRRTSDSSLRSPTRSNFPPKANVDPSAPDNWYRGMASPSAGTRPPPTHARTQSDVAGSRAGQSLLPTLQTQGSLPAGSSRLPVSMKKVTSPPMPSSPVSTRSNSPGPKRAPTGTRTTRQQGAPLATRAKTPTKRSNTPTTRAKTPTHATPTPSRKNPPSHISTPSGSRLNAYITTAAPPKLSPTLRSSRPRQPVSTATTASSRMKTVERGRSPGKPGSKPTSSRDESASQKRKIDVGPIDFARRRETIRLAYSKSIRETEVKAAERRRRRAAEVEARATAAREETDAGQSTAKHPQAAGAEEEPYGDYTLRLVTSPDPDAPPPVPLLGLRQSKAYDSPTLGIPGTFPSFGSPLLEQDEVPQSAVTATSDVTEFDNETQTEPPLQDDVDLSHTGVGGHAEDSRSQSAHEKVEYRSPFDVPVVKEPDTPVSEGPGLAEQYASAHERATYRYPFEDDHGNDEDIDIQISLDISSPTQTSPRRRLVDDDLVIPGSYRDDYVPRLDEADGAVQPGVRREEPLREGLARSESRNEPRPEYEPQPFRSESFHTTVTILGRDAGFNPSASVSSVVGSRHQEPNLDSLEDFYVGVGPPMRDNVAALRDSTFTASEISDETPQTSAEIQRTPDTSNSLTIPPLLSPANRSSQQSGWTDFSIDSGDPEEYIAKETAAYAQEPVIRNQRSTRRIAPRPDSTAQDPGYHGIHQSPDISPLGDSNLEDNYPHKHRLPELDTGDGFNIPYLSDREAAPPVPSVPDHEPPPIPTSDPFPHDGRQTPSSSYYDQTRPSSYFQDPSGRESLDYQPSTATPYSVDQMSVTTFPQSIGGATLVEDDTIPAGTTAGREASIDAARAPQNKERGRLTQRHMVIKEIIDTETVFVRDMNIVEEIYKGTAEACPQLDSKTIKLIFRNTDEIIAFHTAFLTQLKDGVACVYTPKGRRSPQLKDTRENSIASDAPTLNSTTTNTQVDAALLESDDAKDRQTSVGPVFSSNVDTLRAAHEGFLRTSEAAAKRLIMIQEDPAVKLWLNECNEAAKDLTAAWNLDSLLIKPMQRITKYPNLISQLLQYTPADHPDRTLLVAARSALETAILDINKTKKNFELVGQIVGRKRKESDVRAGFARAFGKRVDKLQASSSRPVEDLEYQKLHEKFGDDYLRLQVVLRDVEYYTRQVSAYVHEFLQYLSAMELVMRLQPSPFPELESKWARFNVSMRDMEKVALDQHLAQVRKHVIEPFELVIKCYGNPSLAMKKRAKRRLDYEKAAQLKKSGKKVDKQLAELVEQYEALNETLKKELPRLSDNTVKIGNICLGNFVNIQAKWFSIWKEKVKVVLEDKDVPQLADVVSSFQREFKDMEEQVNNISILNPALKGRTSHSTVDDSPFTSASASASASTSTSTSTSRIRPRPPELLPRGRGLSLNGDVAPALPTPDFAQRHSGQFSPSGGQVPSPHHYYYRDYYAGLNLNNHGHSRAPSGSPIAAAPDPTGGPRPPAPPLGRPNTGLSFESTSAPPPSTMDPSSQMSAQSRRDSASTYNSNYIGQENRRFSGLFHSALPAEDTEESRKSSRASSRERPSNNGYNILWLAASLFEFNIETAKHEAGYPYLTYQAGEVSPHLPAGL